MPSLRRKLGGGRKTFIWLSDPHVDPYYGDVLRQQCLHKSATLTSSSKFGVFGCDPPQALLDSAAAAAAAAAPEAEFVVFSGDFVRHGQNLMPDPYANVSSVIGEVASTLESHKPGLAPAEFLSLGTLGNDDTPQNYQLNVTTLQARNPWLVNVASFLSKAGSMTETSSVQYSYGGYYEQELGGLTILTINTIIYSDKHVPISEPLPPDPFRQFEWLRGQLQKASRTGRPVWIVGHIPPGIETFGYTELWHPVYVEAYLKLVQDTGFIAAQLFGHVHADEFRILPGAPPAAGPVLLSGAISPVYGCQPSFRVVEYDQTSGRLLSYRVYYAELTPGSTADLKWRFGYDAMATYKSFQRGGEPLTQEAYVGLAEEMSRGGATWNTYASWYKARYSNDLNRCGHTPTQPGDSVTVRLACVAEYMCALRISTKADFEACSAAAAGASEGVFGTAPTPGDHDPDAASPGGAFYPLARDAHRSRLMMLDAVEHVNSGEAFALDDSVWLVAVSGIFACACVGAASVMCRAAVSAPAHGDGIESVSESVSATVSAPVSEPGDGIE